MPSTRGWWTSWILQSWVLGVIAIASILSRFGFSQAPLFSDRAYFTYIGQAMLRGEPFYQTTFMGYPPFAAMLSAAAMWVAQWFDIPTYLAPRYFSVLVAALTVALLALVARHALGSVWAGAFAGVLLAGSSTFGEYTVGTLEPKALVNLLTLATALALQHHRVTLSGVFCGLASMCFQPAVVVVAVAFAVGLWGCEARRRKAVYGFAVGVVIALLPSLFYIVDSASLWEYWQRAVLLPAADQLPGSGWSWERLSLVWRYWGGPEHSEAIITIGAGAGLLLFAISNARSNVRVVASTWLDSRTGGIPLLTLIWAGYTVLTVQGEPDLIPLLPLRAFWAAWLASFALRSVLRLVGNWAAPVRACSALLGAVAALWVLVDGSRHSWRPTLEEQERFVANLTAAAGPEGVVSSFGAEWIYVLSERRSPNPFLRLNRKLAPFLGWVEPGGCNSVLQRLEAERPAVVVTAQRRASECESRISNFLDRRRNSEGRRIYERKLVILRRRLSIYRLRRAENSAAWLAEWAK